MLLRCVIPMAQSGAFSLVDLDKMGEKVAIHQKKVTRIKEAVCETSELRRSTHSKSFLIEPSGTH